MITIKLVARLFYNDILDSYILNDSWRGAEMNWQVAGDREERVRRRWAREVVPLVVGVRWGFGGGGDMIGFIIK